MAPDPQVNRGEGRTEEWPKTVEQLRNDLDTAHEEPEDLLVVPATLLAQERERAASELSKEQAYWREKLKGAEHELTRREKQRDEAEAERDEAIAVALAARDEALARYANAPKIPCPDCRGGVRGSGSGEHTCETCKREGFLVDHSARATQAEAALSRVRELVDEQAEDEALWAEALSIVEAYTQQELRTLHALIESVTDRAALHSERSTDG